MSFQHLSSRLLRTCALILIASLYACGGSDSGTVALPTDCTNPSISDVKGCAYVALTDAPGDFLSYTVDVTALTLTRSDGTVVNLLPNATRVDFAQYNDLNEFLTLTAMPIGIYSSGSITLDYTDADLEVADSAGDAHQVMPVNANGDPITTITLAINLDSQGTLALAPGIPQVYQVGFDLDASNVVNLTNFTVTVQPFLIANANPDLDDQAQVRGPLATIDNVADSFTLELQPFYATTGDYGNLSVLTKNDTVYNINQTAYSGNRGFAALAAAGATTPVIVKGTFNYNADEFIATEVDAGSSVPGGTLDMAEGVVLSRSGNSLVLRGTTLYRAGQTAVFRDKVTVTLGSGTKVHEAGSSLNSLDIGAISVGQRLLVFGNLTNTDPSSLVLDASSGFARLDYTRSDGYVQTAPTSSGGNVSMAVNLQFIESRPVSMFNFAGASTTVTDPTNYVVAMPRLLSSIAVNDPVRVWGFTTPFGTAPPDYTATSVADYVDADSRLVMVWPSPGTSNAFLALATANGIIPSLTSSPAPLLFGLRQGGIFTPISISGTLSNPTVQASLGVFAIEQGGTVQLHLTFADFVSDLNARLNAGGKLSGFFARGGFASGTQILTATEIEAIIQ